MTYEDEIERAIRRATLGMTAQELYRHQLRRIAESDLSPKQAARIVLHQHRKPQLRTQRRKQPRH